ncbi:MAG: hypothetical protein WAN00_20460, partial [Trebonia sp.]
ANVLASITAVVTDELAPATQAGPLWPVLSGLLRKDPDQRLDAAETERLLRVVSAAPAYVVTPAAPSPRRSQGSLAAAVGSAALVVLAAGGTAVGLGLARSQNHPPTSAVVTPPSAASTHPATASARPTTSASPHTTARTSPATTSPAYVSHNDDPNPKSHHGHGHSKSSKGQGDNSQD